ncbi:MAG TPA: M60 family metallopeptidase [Arachidicoccus soli]|nr:M60 family metallopeptidase [Arachidicoccus soli]
MKKVLFAMGCLFSVLLAQKSSAQQIDTTPENIMISPQKPLSVRDTSLRMAILKWSDKVLKSDDYKNVQAQPSFINFPGAVKEGAVKIEKIYHLNHQPIDNRLIPIVSHLGYSGAWNNNLYSTGLYAVAGVPIEVIIPKELTDKNISIQIGSHSDNLGTWVAGTQDWRRMPRVVKVEKLKKKITNIASPFGGLVYISVSPREQAIQTDIKIKNAIAAPLFQLGKTTDQQWFKQLKDNKAPWGELASNRIIITLPDSVLQKVVHPDSVMDLWNLIIGAEMDLAQIDTPFYRPQRMVVDEHIGGGFMHSGYPIMVHHSPTKHMYSEDIIANPEKLLIPTKGGANWGFFHEIGHNMQNLDWVFGGTTEVSNNLFSLYCFDRLMGGQDDAHSGVSSENTQKMMRKYFAKGADYTKWKADPFLGLILFRQLQEGFGWESFKTFFKGYHDLAAKYPNHAYAQTDQQKRDLWVINFSRIVGRNLAPFFEKWGIPISEDAKQKVVAFPVWMPYNFPPAD